MDLSSTQGGNKDAASPHSPVWVSVPNEPDELVYALDSPATQRAAGEDTAQNNTTSKNPGLTRAGRQVV